MVEAVSVEKGRPGNCSNAGLDISTCDSGEHFTLLNELDVTRSGATTWYKV